MRGSYFAAHATLRSDRPRKLDLSPRVLLVHFLSDLRLITSTTKDTLPLISLTKVNLQGADLREAYLQGADLREADLREAHLQRADLREAHLQGANLQGANITPKQLGGAYRLKDARLPDGSLYPSTSYPIPDHREPTI